MHTLVYLWSVSLLCFSQADDLRRSVEHSKCSRTTTSLSALNLNPNPRLRSLDPLLTPVNDDVQTHLCTLTQPSVIPLGQSIGSTCPSASVIMLRSCCSTLSSPTFPSEDRYGLRASNSSLLHAITGDDTEDDTRA